MNEFYENLISYWIHRLLTACQKSARLFSFQVAQHFSLFEPV